MSVTKQADLPELPSPKEAKAIRVRACMTQAQLADAIGVHELTVTRWEKDVVPRGLQRRAYADLLNRLRREDLDRLREQMS